VTARLGTPMMVLLRNGETVEGRFDGFSDLPG
jgi:small nuclear ribonucleoprotein (snRNP)-like protein